ncbi:MAG: transglutaminase, partial [Ruminococcus sp.]
MHSITAVCEGYAKSFQLLMNAAGVSNFYIVGLGNGGGHAWNMAQMDDGYYYYFDATWDDTAQTSKYFAAGETSFSKNHSPYVYDKSGWEFLYDLP